MRRARRSLVLFLVATAPVSAAACAETERSFSSAELVEKLNAGGAGLVLEEPLPSFREGVELNAVRVEEHDEQASGQGPSGGHEHGGGTLAIMADADAGLVEFERCERAVTLVCFRASNAVLFFEELDPVDRARLGRAFQGLADD